MTLLVGEEAFSALRASLSGKRAADSYTCDEIPYERLRWALVDNDLSPVDRIVRLRHALRYAFLTDPYRSENRGLPIPNCPGWPQLSECTGFGLKVRPGRVVDALPWCPDWLDDVPVDGVDATATIGAPRPWNSGTITADPWVKNNLGFGEYRGPGQALAVRSALHIASGQTLLILLPTGEGKSLVFQTLAAAHPDKTVAVVVPTVTLAQDHAESIHQFPILQPGRQHAYVGSVADTVKAEIRNSISSGTQGLVYAAPEAMVTSLRQPLIEAARFGRLAALVIDEAHLVDAWGTDFRSEFQMLAALVAELRSIAPIGKQPSIVCLSATVTQSAMETLESLFSPNAPISLVPATRLRPEPDIWLSTVCSSEEERAQRVIEALRFLPRPAILYVTTPDEAEDWLRRVRNAGFGRVKAVHGGTSGEDRAKVVRAWRTGDLDLVVGNSAFGLGIDFSHVRTVIHACVPESLDRYYQEIGRAGRDGHASVALLLPTRNDFVVAKRLSTKRIISVDKGIRRWRAMFNGATQSGISTTRYEVDLSSAPDYDPDMKSEAHENWNGRVLALMARAKIIRMVGLHYDDRVGRMRTVIELLEDGHSERPLWDDKVKNLRYRLFTAHRTTYFSMCDLIKNDCCPSTILAELYQLEHCGIEYPVVVACGGCAQCRKKCPEGWFSHWPSAPKPPWPIGRASDHLKSYLEHGRVFVERVNDTWLSRREQRRLRDMFNGLWDGGINKCIVVGQISDMLDSALGSRPWCVAQSWDGKILTSNGLPSGPEVVWIGIGSSIKNHHLNAMPDGQERVIFFPSSPNDPLNPSCQLADRFTMVPFDKFFDYLLP